MNRKDNRYITWKILVQKVPEERFSLALSSLSESISTVLRMYYSENRSVAEIANDIGKSISVVRNHRNKGIFLLEKEFPEYLEIANEIHVF